MTAFTARLSAVAAQGITTVYLAGPMAGIADHNFPAFNQWASDLLAFFIVTNPADADDLNEDGSLKFPWEHLLTRDVRDLTAVDAVMALPGWKTSRGATFELLVATILGKRCFDLATAEEANVAFELEPADVFEAFAGRWRELTGLFYVHDPVPADGRIFELMRPMSVPDTTLNISAAPLSSHICSAPGTLNIVAEPEPEPEPEPLTPNILEEANEIIHGDRAADYGHPIDNHGRTGAFWGTYLGITISPEQVCFLNVLQKISRGMNAITRDTLVDIAGYAGNVEMVQRERDKREPGS